MPAKKKTAPVMGAGMTDLRQHIAAADRALLAMYDLAGNLAGRGELLSEIEVWRAMDELQFNVGMARDAVLTIAR